MSAQNKAARAPAGWTTTRGRGSTSPSAIASWRCRVERPSEVGATVVAMRDATPVLVRDVADVREGPAPRRGIAHRLAGEIVSCRVAKQFDADTVKVVAGVRAVLPELEKGIAVHRRAAARALT